MTLPVERAFLCSGVLDVVLARAGMSIARISAWIVHAGGRDVLLSMQQQLELPASSFAYSAATLCEYGNLSSALILRARAALADDAPGGWWWLTSSAPASAVTARCCRSTDARAAQPGRTACCEDSREAAGHGLGHERCRPSSSMSSHRRTRTPAARGATCAA